MIMQNEVNKEQKFINIAKNIEDTLSVIKHTRSKYNINHEIKLLCVSKKQSIEKIIQAYECGQRDFGESYINEAIDKIEALNAKGYTDINWHFIGPIQANKTKYIANYFKLVHSIDREKILKRLNEQRDPLKGPLEVLIEINLSGQEQKSGCTYEQLESLINYAQGLENIKLKGLMGIGTLSDDPNLTDQEFAQLFEVFNKYKKQLKNFDILSLGMSHDLISAIKNGSTMLRIGSSIFGPRG